MLAALSPCWCRRFRAGFFAVAQLGTLVTGGLVAAASGGAADEAAAPAPRVYRTVRLTGPAPVIDGRLDDACWSEQGEWAGDYTQREPRQGAAPTHPTEIKILYDNNAIYVAIRAHQPGVGGQPRLMGARDEFTGDMVGIDFDSYRDRRYGFEFNVTSGGSKIDLLLHNDGSVDTSWNAVWEVRTAVTADAWTAEYRIPLSQLRYQRGSDQVWGLHCWRWLGAKQEESDWNLIPMDHHGMLYSFGELQGLRDLPASRRIEIAPYFVAKTHRYGSEAGNPWRDGSDSSLEGGLDAKLGIGPNLTLDLTLNPDFSQVDADPSEINLSTVETFRTERRPFFLEGKDLFDFKLDDDFVFYSRRIGDAPSLSAPASGLHDSPEYNRILGAAKLTGHTPSGLTVALLHAAVDRTRMRVLDAEGTSRVTVEPRTDDTVVRLQQDFAAGNSRVGVIASSSLRQGSAAELQTLPRQAFTYGADAQQYFGGRNYLVEGKILGTQVNGSTAAITALLENPVHNYQRPDADHLGVDLAAEQLNGHAGYVQAGRVSGLWRYNGFVSWRSPGVEFNDLGYLQTADYVEPGAQIQYYNTKAGTLFRRRDLRLKYTEPRDFGGTRLGRKLRLESEFSTMSGAYLWTRIGAETGLLDPRVLRGGPALRIADQFPLLAYFETDGGSPLQFQADAGYSLSGEGGSRDFYFKPGLVWKLGSRVRAAITVGYGSNQQPTQYAGTDTGGAAPVYVLGHLDQQILSSTLKLTVNFSPTLSLSYYGGPFATTGRYSDFKAVINPGATAASDRYAAVALQRHGAGGLEGDFRGSPLRLSNPDFDWREFKSNLVLRWEYRAGAFLYCVWSQYREDVTEAGGFAPLDQYSRLFSARPDNTILLKFSYWFSL